MCKLEPLTRLWATIKTCLTFLTLRYPQELNYCQACHNGTASQDINWLTQPTRATCGSCHDDVNFVSGENHAAGAQADDSRCARCHIAEGELEFDASVKGAHTVPRFSRDLPGVKFEIVEVKNTQPGQNPTVTLKITDGSGFPIETSQMNSLSLLIAGRIPTMPGIGGRAAVARPAKTAHCTYTFTEPYSGGCHGSFHHWLLKDIGKLPCSRAPTTETRIFETWASISPRLP